LKGAEFFQRGAVSVLAVRLNIFFVPVETEPFEILDGRRRRAGLVAGMIQIFHAHDNAAAERPGAQPCDHERAHVPQMQRSRGTWSEPSDIRF
jgi:hypothetical protein